MRYTAIDLLRSFAIFVMIFVHFSENLAGYTPLIAGLGVPTFLFLSGVSYRLWLLGQYARGVAEEDINTVTLRRGGFLFLLGLAFNICVWLPNDLFNWDVLTLIAVSLMLLNVARNLPISVIFFFCLCVAAITPSIQSLADYSSYWKDGFYDPDWTLPDTIQGFLAVGYFPIFPWVIYSLLGYAVAYLLFSNEQKEGFHQRVATGLMIVGASLILIAASVVYRYRAELQVVPNSIHLTWSMFPASLPYLCGSVGFVTFSLGGNLLWLDRPAQAPKLTRLSQFAFTFSRHSLTAYVLHHIVHLYPLWLYTGSQGLEPTAYWRKATPIPAAFLLGFAFLPCLYYLFRWMDRTHRQGIEGWMRRLCG